VRDGTGGSRFAGRVRRRASVIAGCDRSAAFLSCCFTPLSGRSIIRGTRFSIVHPANPAVTRISFYRQPGGFFSSCAPSPPGDAHARVAESKIKKVVSATVFGDSMSKETRERSLFPSGLPPRRFSIRLTPISLYVFGGFVTTMP